MLSTPEARSLGLSHGPVHGAQRSTEPERRWPRLPLCRRYQAVLLDTQPIQVWGEGTCVDRAIFWALGFSSDGHWEVLDAWLSPTSGGPRWPLVFDDLRSRGVERVRVLMLPECDGAGRAARAVFPSALLLPSIASLQRKSLMQVPPRHRSAAMAALDGVCQAPSVASARGALDAFAAGRFGTCPASVDHWCTALEQLAPFYCLPERLRCHIRSGCGISQRLHHAVGQAVKRRGAFVDGESALSLVLEVLRRRLGRDMGVAVPVMRSRALDPAASSVAAASVAA